MFSPKGGIANAIVDKINEAQSSIDVMVYSLTYQRFAKALLAAKERGVSIRLIADESKAHDSGSLINLLIKDNVEIKIIEGDKNGLMHNKIAIFDNKSALTGSYNWTYSAENYNYENAIFLDDPQTVMSYINEFNDLWIKNSTYKEKRKQQKRRR
jgi:phosphatidylserine/phosphatidylglycerophosphate/cardiolipin synthase-like enzyme